MREAGKFNWLYVGAIVLVVGSYAGVKRYKTLQINNAKNFRPDFVVPLGWRNQPHGPATLFKILEPSTNLELRAAVNQVVAEVNPTPDLDTHGIANFYMERTQQSMPSWKAVKLKEYINRHGTDFEILRRSTKDRIVVTAYAVRGNTTFLVTLFGKNGTMRYVDPGMTKLYSFLSTVSLNEQDLSQL
jgi:hypothetical protein